MCHQTLSAAATFSCFFFLLKRTVPHIATYTTLHLHAFIHSMCSALPPHSTNDKCNTRVQAAKTYIFHKACTVAVAQSTV